jgi:hypothetical protein
MEIDSLISYDSLEEMAYHYKSGREKSLIPFERIYSLPLQISDKNSNRYTTTVSQAIPKLTRTDYSELKVHNKKVTDELSTSLLWNFMQLPYDIQKTIVTIMMEGDNKATHVFLCTPLWHAIDRYAQIVEIYKRYGHEQNMLPDLFININLSISPRVKTCYYSSKGFICGLIPMVIGSIGVTVPMRHFLLSYVGLFGVGIGPIVATMLSGALCGPQMRIYDEYVDMRNEVSYYIINEHVYGSDRLVECLL